MGWLDWDEFANDYDGVFLLDPVYINMLEMLLGQIGDANGKRILDIGCGTGNLAFQLLQRSPGSLVLGMDPSAKMRELFSSRFSGLENVAFTDGDALAIPARDSEFDFVVTSLALHHVPRETKAGCASELARVLKPGGTLLYADRFVDRDGPPGDPERARDTIRKMTGWAMYCLDNNAYEKAVMIIESIPNDLRENGEYVITSEAWLGYLRDAGFTGLELLAIPPAEYGLKVIRGELGGGEHG